MDIVMQREDIANSPDRMKQEVRSKSCVWHMAD